MTRLLSLLSAGVALLCIGAARAADDACATASCLANGDTPCDRATGLCPPCMYTIPGGYSCYGKVGSACPYPDTLTICPDPTPTILTAAPAAAPVATTTPRLTTAAPKATTTPAVVDTASSSGSAGPASNAKTPSGASASSASSETAPISNAAKPTVTPSAVGTVMPSNGTASTPSPTDRQDALAADTKSENTKSQGAVNIAIIVAAAVGVLVVAIFIVRRVRQRRELPMQDMDFKTPHLGGQKDFAPGPQSTRRQNQSRYTHTQTLTERIDFSTLEAQNPPTIRTKSARPSIASSMASSEMVSSPHEFAVGTSGRSNMPPSYSEDKFGQVHTASRPRTKSRVRGIETSLIQNQFPELVGSYNSDASSVISAQSEDFDIVDPGAIRPGERRNTETLVADGRFRQFSTASLAESYVSDATTEGSEYGTSVYI